LRGAWNAWHKNSGYRGVCFLSVYLFSVTLLKTTFTRGSSALIISRTCALCQGQRLRNSWFWLIRSWLMSRFGNSPLARVKLDNQYWLIAQAVKRGEPKSNFIANWHYYRYLTVNYVKQDVYYEIYYEGCILLNSKNPYIVPRK
jgi:hypothetical protein